MTEYVQALERGLAVLRAFRPTDKSLTVGRIARRTFLCRTAVRRNLLTLEALGYVTRSPANPAPYARCTFTLTPHVLVLAAGLPAAQPAETPAPAPL